MIISLLYIYYSLKITLGMIHKKIIFFTFVTYLLVGNSMNLFGQEEYVGDDNLLRNYDFTYIEDIKTVNFYPLSQPLNYPIIGLNDGSLLELSFDDMSEDIRDYQYEVIHCDANWQQSELTEMDYLDGFNMELITDYEFSSNTLTNYVNYRMIFPNNNTSITKSGNYLLHIFEDGDRELPIITRRFMVTEGRMQVIPRIARTGSVSKARTHQEIDFSVNHKGINIQNPYNDVKVVVTQNGRWDNAISGLTPLFIREDVLIYDFQDKVSFEAGKEFRNFNTQTLRFKTERVKRIVEDRIDKYHIELFAERPRSTQAYTFHNDLNGKYIIENDDQRGNANVRADYAWVHFTLQVDEAYEDQEVYVFGALSEWSLQEQFRMKYDKYKKEYTGKAFLKQGFYDYSYVVVDGSGEEIKTANTEGNWYETENQYHVFVYYRPVGGRFDRLMAVSTINSSDR